MPIDFLPYVLFGTVIVLLIASFFAFFQLKRNKRPHFGPTLTLFLSVGGITVCGTIYIIDFRIAEIHYGRGAKANNPIACYELGRRMLQFHQGVPYNSEKGMKLLNIAATSGNSDAQLMLAAHLLTGVSTQQDTKQAVRWLQSAAEQNNIEAKSVLEEVNKDNFDPNNMPGFVLLYCQKYMPENNHQYSIFQLF
jgi:TPR repeat protein